MINIAHIKYDQHWTQLTTTFVLFIYFVLA